MRELLIQKTRRDLNDLPEAAPASYTVAAAGGGYGIRCLWFGV
jgi:hypothetical protein